MESFIFLAAFVALFCLGYVASKINEAHNDFTAAMWADKYQHRD